MFTRAAHPYTSINVVARLGALHQIRAHFLRSTRGELPQPYGRLTETALTIATQKIFRIRREYNAWVADESIEDYALRYTPRGFRKWSEWRVGNTAFGAVSFLALEAIGAAIALNYGFTNALWAILVVGLITFFTGLPISYYAARYGVDMDLLTRGAGFGYLGSTITSLIYASFTFIFFALEAAIMALALQMYLDIPIAWCYVISAVVIVPLVVRGITLISRLQMWTQPLWGVLLLLPYLAVLWKNPQAFFDFTGLAGRTSGSSEFNPLMFGAAATVAFSLVVQIGEQVDFLRFLPEKTHANRVRWWGAVLMAGPGWIVLGMLKMLGGAFLAFLVLQHELPAAPGRGAHADVPGRLCLRVQQPGLGAGGDGGVRGGLAAQDQPHQRLRGLAGLVQLFRAAHAQPPGPRGVAGVQRHHRLAADDAGCFFGTGKSAGALQQRGHRLGRRAGGRPGDQQAAGPEPAGHRVQARAPLRHQPGGPGLHAAGATAVCVCLHRRHGPERPRRSRPSSRSAWRWCCRRCWPGSPAALLHRAQTAGHGHAGPDGALPCVRERLRGRRHGQLPGLRRAHLLAVLHAGVALP
jgi:hypothetical protein